MYSIASALYPIGASSELWPFRLSLRQRHQQFKPIAACQYAGVVHFGWMS